MKYMMLIYADETGFHSLAEPEQQRIHAEYGMLIGELRAVGKFVGGSALHPTATAMSVTLRNGERLVTDGPFAETREQLGGYFLVDLKDLDEAIAVAARIPSVRNGTIEIRPLAEATVSL